MTAPTPAGELVVVGSSAGGIEALTTLVSSLPDDFPAPIVIAQHIEPQRASHLGEILGRHTRLPVHSITDGERPRPGYIYVIPADRHVEMANGHFNLQSDHQSRPKPSVNLLFSSAAHIYGDGLIAVILTGAGSDGALGAQEVKKTGGTVIIQNPATASYPAMPRSLPPATVDFVANIEEIGPLLTHLLTTVGDLAQPSEAKALQDFLQHVHERSGLDFTTYKPSTLQRRLRRRLVATGATTLPAYRRYLQRHPDEYTRLISAFLIKVTEFFRDRDLFTALREQVLPELIQAARTQARELRLWSAGCATGEEAYSLAILVSDLLGDDLDKFTVRIFATDLDNDAVAFARRGLYPASAVASLSPELVERHFQRIDSAYEVNKRVRSLVIFGQHDLGQRAPFPRIDLALCRNVLIYFTPEMQKRVLQLFAYSLRDGGYLALGKAETTSPLAEFFVPAQSTLKLYRRQGERLLFSASQFRDATPMQPMSVLPQTMSALRLAPSHDPARVRTTMDKLGTLVFHLPLGVVVVNRRYDVQIINSAAHRLLGIHRAALGEDLLHLADQTPTKPLRDLIDGVIQGRNSAPHELQAQVETETGQALHLLIAGYSHQLDGDAGPTDGALLLIRDITAQVTEGAQTELNHPLPAAPVADPPSLGETETRQQIERLTQQVQRLTAINRELGEANQELTTANVELHQANEEYLVNTEELQAAAEEVETLNEELQASNEELETLNEELQATVEELNTTNDDLEARSNELEELARDRGERQRVSEAERVRLEAILVNMGDAVLVVDPSGKPILTNEAYQRMFGDAATPPPWNDEAGVPIAAHATPQARAARGETFSTVYSLATDEEGRRWYEANGKTIESGAVRGGVVVIRDISDRSLRRLQNEFLALASHELRTPLTSMSIMLQLLVRKLGSAPDGEAARKEASLALRQVDRLDRLVGDLMDVGRLQTGQLKLQLQPINLAELLTHTVETMQLTAPDRAIILNTPRELVMVNGDAVRLEQVVMNLVINALKYTPDGKRIDVRLQRRKGQAEIQVQDDGLGIAPENLKRLFTRFYQVAPTTPGNREGLGLGLFISQELINAHGGAIAVSSPPSKGATFTITLPLLA